MLLKSEMKLNYYSDFRLPAYNSHQATGANLESETMGRFDPMNSVLYLKDDIATALDTRGELPHSSVEEPGSPVSLSFATYLHEIIHWWQHVGSTAGFIYSLGIPTQSLATAKYVYEARRQIAKPFIDNVSQKIPLDHPAWLAVLRWSEAEFGATLMYSPRTATATLKANPNFYESLGHSVLSLYIQTMAALASTFDQSYLGLPNPLPWFDQYEHFARTGKPCFSPNEIIELPLGLHELFEAQARLSELQYRALTYKQMTWAEAKAGGWLSKEYGRAFKLFLELSGLPEPESLFDSQVYLFLLLCDIAVNPEEGYPGDVLDDGHFVYRTHPGIRFMKLCRLVSKEPGAMPFVETLSLKGYEAACEILCSKAGWATPVQIGEHILSLMDHMSGMEELLAQDEAGDYGVMDVPIRFHFMRHRAFLESKVSAPHFFCWPAAFLAVPDNPGHDVEPIQELLSWHLPPFLTDSLNAGVSAHNLPQMEADKRSKFVSDYFSTQVLYDLVRQWISLLGPFSLSYPWKPKMSAEDEETLRHRFKVNFDIEMTEIEMTENRF